jgi:hypothetical protein
VSFEAELAGVGERVKTQISLKVDVSAESRQSLIARANEVQHFIRASFDSFLHRNHEDVSKEITHLKKMTGSVRDIAMLRAFVDNLFDCKLNVTHIKTNISSLSRLDNCDKDTQLLTTA